MKIEIEVTDEMIEAFGQAWQKANDEGAWIPGARRRAGLKAAIEVMSRNLVVHGLAPEPFMVVGETLLTNRKDRA